MFQFQFKSRKDKVSLHSDTKFLDKQQGALHTFEKANLASKADVVEETSIINENRNSFTDENKIENHFSDVGYSDMVVTNIRDCQKSNNFTGVDEIVSEKSGAITQRSKCTDEESFEKKTTDNGEKYDTVRSTFKGLFTKDGHVAHEADNYNRTKMFSKISEIESKPEGSKQNKREIAASDYSRFYSKATSQISVDQFLKEQFQHQNKLPEQIDTEAKMMSMPVYGLKTELSHNGVFNKKLTAASNDNRFTLQMDGSDNDISLMKPYGIYSNVMFLPDKSKGASPKRYGPKRLGMQSVVKVSSQNSDNESESSRLNSLNLEDDQNLNVDNALEQSTITQCTVPKVNLQTISSSQSGLATESFENDLEFDDDHFGLFTGAVACGVTNIHGDRGEGSFCIGGHGCKALCVTNSGYNSPYTTNKMEVNSGHFTEKLESSELFSCDMQFGRAKWSQNSPDKLEVLNNDNATNVTNDTMQPVCISDATCNHSDEDGLNSSKDNGYIYNDKQNNTIDRSKCNSVSYPTFGKNCQFDIDWSILHSRQGRFASTLRSSNTNIAEDNRFCMEFSLPFKCGVLEEETELSELPSNKGSGLHFMKKEISTCYNHSGFVDNDLGADSELCTKTAVSVLDQDDLRKNNFRGKHKKRELNHSELELEVQNPLDELRGPHTSEQGHIGLSYEDCDGVVGSKLQQVGGYDVIKPENSEITSDENAAVKRTDSVGKTESLTNVGKEDTQDAAAGFIRNEGDSENETMNRSSSKKEADLPEKSSIANHPGLVFGSKSFPRESEDFQKVYKQKKTKPEHDNRLVLIDEADNSNSKSCLQTGLIGKLRTFGRKQNAFSIREPQHKHSDMLEFFRGLRGFGSGMDLDFSAPPHEFQRQIEKHHKRMMKRFSKSWGRQSKDKMRTSPYRYLGDEVKMSRKQDVDRVSKDTEESMDDEERFGCFFFFCPNP